MSSFLKFNKRKNSLQQKNLSITKKALPLTFPDSKLLNLIKENITSLALKFPDISKLIIVTLIRAKMISRRKK